MNSVNFRQHPTPEEEAMSANLFRAVTLAAIFSGVVLRTINAEEENANQQKTNPHEQWRSVEPFAINDIKSLAAKAKFTSDSKTPATASDVFDYFDIVSPTPELTKSGPFIIGRITVKADQVTLKETGASLPAGDYFHWLGSKDGVWIAGFTSVSGDLNVTCSALFTVAMSDDVHEHIKVWTHSPSEARELAVASAMGGPPVPRPPVPPPKPQPPRPQPQPPKPPKPDDGGHHPPKPPARCIQLWSRSRIPGTNPPQYFCSQSGWVVN
jgi:hypothetical protein